MAQKAIVTRTLVVKYELTEEDMAELYNPPYTYEDILREESQLGPDEALLMNDPESDVTTVEMVEV